MDHRNGLSDFIILTYYILGEPEPTLVPQPGICIDEEDCIQDLEVEEVDQCQISPCQNQGTCIDLNQAQWAQIS